MPKVVAINPNEAEVEGLKTYKSVLDVPDAIDMNPRLLKQILK